MEDNFWLGCLSVIIVIVATYFGVSYLMEEDRKFMAQPVEELCPRYSNSRLRNVPAKCIEYFSGKENK